jgi:hypothetical protein
MSHCHTLIDLGIAVIQIHYGGSWRVAIDGGSMVDGKTQY